MSESLKNKTVNGLLWSVIERFSTQAVSFVLGIFIARILTPDDYGTVALLAIFFAISGGFVDSGFSSALVRKVNRSETDNSTAFYFNVVVGAVVYAILFFCAPLIASFFDVPVLKELTRAIAITIPINSLCIVQQAQLTTKIDFKSQAKVALSAAIISGVTGLIMAHNGYGVWAIATQMVVASFVRGVLLWVIVSWRPTMPFSKESFKELFGYGSKLLASGLLDTTYNNVYSLVIGKIFSPASLGNYSRAAQFAQFPSSNITGILQRVTFPVLCTIQDDDDRLRLNYRRIIRMSAFIIFPLMLGLSALAAPTITVILTEKWANAIPFLQIICFSMMWYPIHAINLNLLQVKGRSDLFLRLEIIKKCVGVSILCITIPMGLIAMCYGKIISSLIALVINTHYTSKLIDVGFLKQMKDLAPTLIRSIIMWLLVGLVISYVDSNILKLVVGVAVGAIYYLGAAYIFKSQDLQDLMEILKLN